MRVTSLFVGWMCWHFDIDLKLSHGFDLVLMIILILQPRIF